MDESGHDLKESPYEVLAGICVEDRDLWNFVTQAQMAEEEFFGQRVTQGLLELKGKKILKRKVFRLAGQMPPFQGRERRDSAQRCLLKGQEEPAGSPTRAERRRLWPPLPHKPRATRLHKLQHLEFRRYRRLATEGGARSRGGGIGKGNANSR